MPPRIPSRKFLPSSLASHTPASSSSLSTSSSASASSSSQPFLSQTSTRSLYPSSSSSTRRKCHNQRRAFSSTPAPATKLRNDMFAWLNGPGAAFKHPLPGSTNYLSAYDRSGKLLRAKPGEENKPEQQGQRGQSEGAEGSSSDSSTSGLPRENASELRPFPLNPNFVSQSVLSEELRNEIHNRVVEQGKSVRAVSVELGVDMRRVAAVVRLVELEKKWVKEGKPQARPYARAVHQMLPTTPYNKPPTPPVPHEPINDLPVHRLTDPQIFYPVSESRQFTREDAGRVFSAAPALPVDKDSTTRDPTEALKITRNPESIERVGKGTNEHQVLQPADVRIPHPHLIAFERDRIEKPSEFRNRSQAYSTRLEDEEAALAARKRRQKEHEDSKVTKVEPEGARWQFRFRDTVVSADKTGKDGRGTAAPGRRYGAPNMGRKKGAVKIPTRVEV